jgi:hypothetical protein
MSDSCRLHLLFTQSATTVPFFAILSEQIPRSIAGNFSLAELSWKFLSVMVTKGFDSVTSQGFARGTLELAS